MIPVKSILINELNGIKEKEVAVFLSGGIDSASVALTALELGKTVTAYSFTLDGHVSSDFSRARHFSSLFKMGFTPVFLPTDIKSLMTDVCFLINHLGLKKKSDIECTWPMIYAINKVKENVILTGACADGHFCISKKGMIHYRHSLDKIDAFRRALFNNPNYAQVKTLNDYCISINKTIIAPYYSNAMHKAFLGHTWDAVNKPKQKQPILDAFPEQFARIKTYPHTNLQLGDSGIAQHFTKLLKTRWNKNNYKSVVGIYNSIIRGDIDCKTIQLDTANQNT